MILNEINHARAAFILGESLGPYLEDFFKKNKSILILGKHKVQNLPKEFQKSLKILFELNDEEFELFKVWASLTLDRLGDDFSNVNLGEAIGYFLINECKLVSKGRSKEKDTFCSRVILLELLKENPDAGLLAFLSSGIPYGAPQEKPPQSPDNSLKDVFNQRLISTILDDTFLENIDDLSSEAEALSIDLNVLKNKLEKNQQPAVNSFETIANVEQDPVYKKSRGLTSEDEIDLDEAKVYAYVSKVLDSGLRFLTPVALSIDGQLIHFDKDEAKTLFPMTGDLVWYQNDQKRTLSTNQYGLFSVELSRVAQRSHEVKTQYSVKEFLLKIDPVVKVNETVTTLPKLGDWLRQNEGQLASTESLVVYKNDLIKPHFKDVSHIQFETKMEVIESYEIVDIQHHFYVEDFKSAERYYDFSPIDLIIKRLIKQTNNSTNSFTKAQLTALLLNIEDFKIKAPILDPHCYDEALDLIKDFMSFQENLDLILDDILEIQSVKFRVEEAIATRVKESETGFRDTQAQLVAELDQIRTMINEAKKAHKSEDEKAKKIKTSLANDISKIYLEAVEDGRKVLSQSAISEGIITKPFATPVVSEQSFLIHDFDGGNLDVDSVYKLVPSGLAYKSFINSLLCLHELRFSLILTGTFAFFIGKILAFELSKKQINLKLVDVYPGASRFAEDDVNNSNQTLIIRNFDISPISIYGSKLLEDAYSSLHINDISYKKQLILLKEDTGLGLDVPKVLDMFAITIDTDQISDYEESSQIIDFHEFEDMIKEGNNSDKVRMIVKAVRTNLSNVSFKDNTEQLSSTLLFLIRHLS